MPEQISLYLCALLVSCVAIACLHPLSIRIGLVDVPRGRKQHVGAVPLIGGIATFCGVTASLLIFADSALNAPYYLVCAGIIVLLGALDDYLDLSVKLRLVVQTFVALAMVYSLDLHLANLGNLFGFGHIELGFLGIPITVIAVIAAINAFNMTDGIDGLAGTLSAISFIVIGLFMSLAGQTHVASLAFVLVVAMLPYLACNLKLFPKWRLFLGDAGSMLIGLSVMWLLILGTQSEQTSFRPVTALWIIAVPLMDMMAITIRRIKKGQSPFSADREHLHHIALRLGLSSHQSLLLIGALSAMFACIGILGEQLKVPDVIMLLLFLSIFALYAYTLQHIWRLLSKLRQHQLKRTAYKKDC